MAYFNYFIKCFIRIFTKKYFKHLLLFLIIFIGFIFINNSKVFAASSTYGDYYNIPEQYISSINNLIEEYHGSYDSFIVMYMTENTGLEFLIGFYNFSEAGRFYSLGLDNNKFPIFYSENSCSSDYIRFGYDFNVAETGHVNEKILFRTGPQNPRNISYTQVYTNRIIYTNNTFNTILFDNTNVSLPITPYFITTDTELQTFDFDYLQINGGNTKYKTTFMGQDYFARFNLKYIYNGVTTNIEILDDYISYNSTDNTWQINIPYNALTNSVVVRNGGVFRYVLEYRLQYETGYDISTNELTYNLTTEQEQNINEDSSKQLQSQILDATQQTNQSINNLNGSINNLDNSINDSNISDINNDTLPQDTTQDITSNGVNGIFQSIYNAFCTGQPQDIVFPFPFTNQSIVLSPSYVRNALTNSNASFIITLIQAFWWYIISRFIIKDVMDKINKIKSGNIENIEKTNIRGDML